MIFPSLPHAILFGAIWAAQVVIPGPNFVRVSAVALLGSRRLAAITSAGTATGNGLWCLAAGLGMTAATQAPLLMTATRAVGAAYFAWYGAVLIRRAIRPGPVHAVGVVSDDWRRLYASGVLTALASPQAVLFFATALTATFGQLHLATLIAAVLIVVGVNLAWYAVVIGILTSPWPRAVFLKVRPWIETMFGITLIGAAVRLVISIDPRATA